MSARNAVIGTLAPPAIVGKEAILAAMETLDSIVNDGSTTVLDQVRRASIDVGEATLAAGTAWGGIGSRMEDPTPQSLFGAAFGAGLALGVLAARAADREVS